MTFAYCHICKDEVVDFGGTCQQGHSFASSRASSTPPPSPPRRVQAPPPPPPPATRPEPVTVWDVLEQGGYESNDPIAAFAPAPRMNWGPESEAPIVRSVRSLIDRSKARHLAQDLETQPAS